MRLSVITVLAIATMISSSLRCSGQTLPPSDTKVINAATHDPSESLVVEQGQTVVIDFGSQSTLSLPGTFSNSGTVYLVSSAQNVTSGTLAAVNIANLPGAVITSVLPTAGIAGLQGFLPSFSFTLNAVNSIVNAGSISSSANLSMIAGGSITNQTGSIISAIENLNLTSMVNVANAGVLSSIAGNVNIDTANLQNSALISSLVGNINLVNTLHPDLGVSVLQELHGTVQALSGTITAATLNETLKAPVTVSGGKLFAENVILNSGEGHLELNVSDLHGALSAHAGTASIAVTAGTGGFNIADLVITGDPNLIYTGTGPFVSPAFNSDGGLVAIDTSSDTVNGSITFTGNINTVSALPADSGAVTLNAGTTITTMDIVTTEITTKSGGSVNLRANGNITTGSINTASKAQNGGSVVIASTAGSIITQNIITSSVTAKGGDLTISGGSIQTGAISTNGAFGGTAVIIGRDNVSVGSVNNNGVIAGNTSITAGTSGQGALNLTSVTTNGTQRSGSVSLVANGSISASGAIDLSGAQNGGQFLAIAGGGGATATATFNTINTTALLVPGQVVIINLSGDVTTQNITTSSVAATGGDVSITAAGTITTGAINTTAPAQVGGDVWLSAGATTGTAITTQSITRTGALGAGEIFFLLNPAATFSTGAITTPVTGADFFGTPGSPVSALSGNVTLSMQAGAVSGFNPGGFLSVAPGSTITLNQAVRIPAPVVARSGGITLNGIIFAPAPLPNQTLTLVASGDIAPGAVPPISGGLVRLISTNGQVTLPSINVSRAAGMPSGGIAVHGSRGVILQNGASLLNNEPANLDAFKPIALFAPNGSITLGAPGNMSGNTISSVPLGPVFLFANNKIINNNVTLATLFPQLTALNVPPSAQPLQTQTPPPVIGKVSTDKNTGFFFALSTPAVAATGTILPTDTLPIKFAVPFFEGEQDVEKDSGKLAYVTQSAFDAPVISQLGVSGLTCESGSTSNTLVLRDGGGVFAPEKDIVVHVNGTTVSVRAGSVVIIAAAQGEFAVYDLFDNTTGDVKVANVTLWPGQMLARSSNGRLPVSTRILRDIGLRPSSRLNMEDGSGFMSDFSILSAISEMQNFRPMLKERFGGGRRVAESILKSAAIQLHMGRGRDSFRATN